MHYCGADRGASIGTDTERFRDKVRAFLRQHLDHAAVAKLRTNEPFTRRDLIELERLLKEGGVGSVDDIKRAAEAVGGLGLFVRSIVGLDAVTAKQAMAAFSNGRALSANQLEFINLIVEHLTTHGYVRTARLYESPFTDLTPRGPISYSALKAWTSCWESSMPFERTRSLGSLFRGFHGRRSDPQDRRPQYLRYRLAWVQLRIKSRARTISSLMSD